MSSMPGRESQGQYGTPGAQYGNVPSGGMSQGGYAGDAYGSHWAGQTGRRGGESPVDRDETEVVGRRVVQYVIDYVLVAIIPGLAYLIFDRGSGFLRGFGWTIATLIALVVYLWYWVLRPNGHNGQTFGMQLLGLRIISMDGGPASMLQYFVRGVLLLVDTLVFGLVGLITMMASRYHQRVGDHVARTLVVGASHGRGGFGQSDFERTGGYRDEDERLASPSTYASDSYGPDMGTAGSGMSDPGTRG